MARSKYSKLTWQVDMTGAAYTTVTPAGGTLTLMTFGVGDGYQITGIASSGNVITNYYEQLNECESWNCNLVEIKGSDSVLAERVLYKKFPELWLTPEAYFAWLIEGMGNV